jgi:hypothetical protein
MLPRLAVQLGVCPCAGDLVIGDAVGRLFLAEVVRPDDSHPAA